MAKTNEICPLAASKLGLWLDQQQRSTAVCMSSTETRHVVCALLPPPRAGCCIVSGWKPASRSVELFWMLMSGAPTSNSSWSLSAATRSCHWIAIHHSPWSYRFPLIVFLFPLAMLAFLLGFPPQSSMATALPSHTSSARSPEQSRCSKRHQSPALSSATNSAPASRDALRAAAMPVPAILAQKLSDEARK